MAEGYASHDACIQAYIMLFQHLSNQEFPQALQCWHQIQQDEKQTQGVILAPRVLRQKLQLSDFVYLLVMAGFVLEIDANLRNIFYQKYNLRYPTLEYGISLISPICSASYSEMSDLMSSNILCDLLLPHADPEFYVLESPLLISRVVCVYLMCGKPAAIPNCTILTQHKNYFPIHMQFLERVKEWYQFDKQKTLYLCGQKGTGRKSLLVRACGTVLYAEHIWNYVTKEKKQMLQKIVLYAKLADAILVIPYHEETALLYEIEQFCHKYDVAVVILTEDESILAAAQVCIQIPNVLSTKERDTIWEQLVLEKEVYANVSGEMNIASLLEVAKLSMRYANGSMVTQAHVQKAMQHRTKTVSYGILQNSTIQLQDMVVSERIQKQLELICQAGSCGTRIFAWDIPRTKEGVTAIFYGASGTGKTMAAIAIANHLHLPLFRVDLSQVMNKYIGETEKHLSNLLRTAKENHCVLLFDEADALFGKRAEVTSGHDKYANITTSFLLQEMEQYHGVALLSTNFIKNFDTAFFRRIQYIVPFEMPNEAERKELWYRAFSRIHWGETLQIELLSKIELSPANIFAVARGTAMIAMQQGRDKFYMEDIQQALSLELEKQGRVFDMTNWYF